jgi:RNA polymerase sigma factor (sigma-70 family)
MRGPTPLLRLQSDERLIALVRRGNHAAFEMLVARYQSRLLAFCRHMLGSREDAEDVLQEVFAAAFIAILADDRAINARPWLYRIARNRSLNHLRRVQPIGVDSMDIHLSEGGATTADKVHKREDFRLLVADVQELPETQKTALLLREIDALSYEQIAEAMETTIPSVKSLLVRARVSLAEAAEARTLTCEQVREELGEVAEGLGRSTAPVRRHVRGCERCQGFKVMLRSTNKALAAVFPVAPLLLFKKALLTQFGMTASAGAGGAAGAAAATVAATGGSSAMSAGISTIATKTAATLAAAAIVTAGAVEVKHVQMKAATPVVAAAKAKPAVAVARVAPEVVAAAQQPATPVTKPGVASSAPRAACRPARSRSRPRRRRPAAPQRRPSPPRRPSPCQRRPRPRRLPRPLRSRRRRQPSSPTPTRPRPQWAPAASRRVRSRLRLRRSGHPAASPRRAPAATRDGRQRPPRARAPPNAPGRSGAAGSSRRRRRDGPRAARGRSS